MFTKSTYFIKEHAGLFKLTDTYDIHDPDNGEVVAQAKENISGLLKAARLVINKNLLPTKIEIRNAITQEVVHTMKKKPGILSTKVVVYDQRGSEMGYFKSKFLSLGGGFHVYNPKGESIAEIKGKWTGWDFKFLDDKKNEIGTVTKQWAGIGKEMFTSADNYVVALSPNYSSTSGIIALLLMAGLSIDIVFKEKK